MMGERMFTVNCKDITANINTSLFLKKILLLFTYMHRYSYNMDEVTNTT